MNEHVTHLATLVRVGTTVRVVSNYSGASESMPLSTLFSGFGFALTSDAPPAKESKGQEEVAFGDVVSAATRVDRLAAEQSGRYERGEMESRARGFRPIGSVEVRCTLLPVPLVPSAEDFTAL